MYFPIALEISKSFHTYMMHGRVLLHLFYIHTTVALEKMSLYIYYYYFFFIGLVYCTYFYGLFIFIRFVVCQVCRVFEYQRIPILHVHVNPCTSNLLQPQRHHLGLVLFSSWARFTQGSSCFGQCQSGTTARAGHCILL